MAHQLMKTSNSLKILVISFTV